MAEADIKTINRKDEDMEISKCQEGSVLSLAIKGDVNSVNADQFIEALTVSTDIDRIQVDLAELRYISSAGLRGLLMAEKAMKKTSGKMIISNVQPDVMEIFRITGFSNILTIE